MKKFLIPFIFLALFLSASHSYAHEFISSGPATLFLHIDPNDTPVPGQVATIYTNIADKEKGFDVDTCNCTLTVGKDGVTLLSAKLLSSTDPNAFGIQGVPVIFPSAGKYDIGVTGAPTVAGAFTAITLDYDITVGEGTGPVTHNGADEDHAAHLDHAGHTPLIHIIHYSLFGVAIVVALWIAIRENGKEKKRKEQSKEIEK